MGTPTRVPLGPTPPSTVDLVTVRPYDSLISEEITIPEMPAHRRLAAILIADVVGFSKLVGVDEEGTLSALKAMRAGLIDPEIERRAGRIVKSTGDGVLAEFASAVNALGCALAVQGSVAQIPWGIHLVNPV